MVRIGRINPAKNKKIATKSMIQINLLPCRRSCLLLLLDHLLYNFSFFYEECTENPVCVVGDGGEIVKTSLTSI